MKIGMNGRFFPQNWRPAVEEITFARRHGFEVMQFRGSEAGLSNDDLGDTLENIATRLRNAVIEPVMEIMLWLEEDGRGRNKLSPLNLLEINLPAIKALGCTCVHWHLGARKQENKDSVYALEETLYKEFERGVALASAEGFTLGLEHNAPEFVFFACPERLQTLFKSVSGLKLVLDINHIIPTDMIAFTELIPDISMLHISDTPLPEVNYHLPVGEGTIDFGEFYGALQANAFAGPAILEIGGTPKSGGYGKDTDEALIISQAKLQQVMWRTA